MADIQLDYRVPAADLQPYVTLFYYFHADVPLFDDAERADHAQFRVKLSSGDGVYTFPDGSDRSSAGWHIIGPTIGPVRGRATGPLEVIGAGLHPAGWAALLGTDASTMVNRVVDAGALFGELTQDAIVALQIAPGTDAKIALFETILRRLVKRRETRALDFARQIDGWLAGSASPELPELMAATGLSRRQVERQCNKLYGAPPKLLARKYRALRAAVALVSGKATLDSLITQGFYDQSHLIREIKEFTGLTPKQMRIQATPLAQATIAARQALEGQVHPLVTGT